MFMSVHQKFKKLCLGKLRSRPWSELDGLQPETNLLLVRRHAMVFLRVACLSLFSDKLS
ncbi:hypothetical protein BT93_G0526 [Corymbia citriodora subsp. variegata]|nr:hypothetical protein BT93_G0526 [Corymbia citriodora subsp. variegata]